MLRLGVETVKEGKILNSEFGIPPAHSSGNRPFSKIRLRTGLFHQTLTGKGLDGEIERQIFPAQNRSWCILEQGRESATAGRQQL
jgi:hypothetical protein